MLCPGSGAALEPQADSDSEALSLAECWMKLAARAGGRRVGLCQSASGIPPGAAAVARATATGSGTDRDRARDCKGLGRDRFPVPCQCANFKLTRPGPAGRTTKFVHSKY